jgi:hypothetical protein
LNAVAAGDRLRLRDRRHRAAIGKGGMQRCEVNTRFPRVRVDHGGILEILAENKVRFKQLSVDRGKNVGLMPSHPLGGSQGAPRIRQARRPIERQSSRPGLAFQHGIHRTTPRSGGNATGRNVRVSLKRQFDDMKPMPHKNGGPVLPDVAEGAKEVIPMQHCAQVIRPALVVASRSRSHGTTNFCVSLLISLAVSPTDQEPAGTVIVDQTARRMSANRLWSGATISRLVTVLLAEIDAARMLLLFSSGAEPGP